MNITRKVTREAPNKLGFLPGKPTVSSDNVWEVRSG